MKTAPAPTRTQLVQDLYAAFGRGDIPALLAALHPDVDWKLNVDPAAPGAKRIPDFQPFRGRAGVGEFFAAIARDLEFHAFTPQAFFAQGDEVLVRVQMELTVRPTGRHLSIESIHAFAFDAGGLVTRFREYLDTLGAAAAWDVVREK